MKEIPKEDKSCGAIVFTRMDGQIQYVLIESKKGIYGFPKGHVENSETETETALREVFEETRLTVELIDGFRIEDHYIISNTKVARKVVYFLGYFQNQNFKHPEEELSGIALLPYAEAMNLLPFDSLKRILTAANRHISLEL